jgi:predicted nuclease of predicted toxin-antitoxin system
MKFLLDANLPYSAKEVFPPEHDAVHVKDAGLLTVTDREVIGWARKHRAAFVSRDLDFANILNFPPREYFGIVVLKVPHFYNAAAQKRVLKGFLRSIDATSLPGSTVIVEEGRMRIKR